ncbi:hypothetical protein MHBO_000030 [Bonamia ostreae]|uniref:Uncharacterized protein n=1 Tax=Bonamia ostreae TaxID=126728 RepID=A0ABV2AEW1_9EUKA
MNSRSKIILTVQTTKTKNLKITTEVRRNVGLSKKAIVVSAVIAIIATKAQKATTMIIRKEEIEIITKIITTTKEDLTITIITTKEEMAIKIITTKEDLTITIITTKEDLTIKIITTKEDLTIKIITTKEDLTITIIITKEEMANLDITKKILAVTKMGTKAENLNMSKMSRTRT